MEKRCWEYTFLLHTCRLGERVVRRGTNPFTGEPVVAHLDKGLDPCEWKILVALLKERGAQRPDPDDEYHRVTFPEDAKVLIKVGDLEGNGRLISGEVEVYCYRLTEDILRFFHVLADAANMAFMDDMGESVALTRPPEDPKIQGRWPGATVIQSPADLKGWLKQRGRKLPPGIRPPR